MSQYCESCKKLQDKINSLQAENERLRAIATFQDYRNLEEKISSLAAELANANIVIKSNSEYEIKQRQGLQAENERLKAEISQCKYDAEQAIEWRERRIADQQEQIKDLQEIIDKQAGK